MISSWVFVAALLTLGAVVRVSAMFYGSLSGDDATVALVARHFLSGENFPVFFYRQTYMGTLNGIHLVPALALFGRSVLVVRLNAVAWSLLFPFGLYLLARRVFDESTGRATLALAAVPPFLLTYWSTVAEPHFETNVFGVWLLLLALIALTTGADPVRTRALAVFGVLAGLAAWTSLKIVGILAPALLLLGIRRPRAVFGRGGALMTAGFVLGSLPAWLYYALHGSHAAEHSGSVSNIIRVGIDLSAARLGEFWSDVALAMLGTYYWSVDTPLRWTALSVNAVLYVLALGIMVAEFVREYRRRPDTPRASGLALLLLTLAATFGAVFVSGHAGEFVHDASRYTLPAYIPLLVCAGGLVVRAGRRSRALGTSVLAFLLIFAAWTNLGFLWPLRPGLRAHEAAEGAGRRAIQERLSTRPVDALYVEGTLPAIVWAFLLDRPTVSAMVSDVYLPNAVAADAAERIDILTAGNTDTVAQDLTAVGATWTLTRIHDWSLFEDIRVPPRGYRMVPQAEWRVLGDARTPPSVADADLTTSWPDPSAGDGNDSVTLDLKRDIAIARVIVWPSRPTSDLFPLRVSGSGDGRRWDTLGVVPAWARRPTFVAAGRPVFRSRNGWLELVVPPRPVRYLRVEPADAVGNAPWGVAELRVYEAAPPSPSGPAPAHRVVERLRTWSVDRILADPVTSARIAGATGGAVSTLAANGVVDNHGSAPPEWLARPIRLRSRDALLVPIEEVPELRDRLEAADTRYEAEAIGDQALVRLLTPLESTAPCRPVATRAVTRGPPTDGRSARITVEATLRDETLVSGARLWHPAGLGSALPTVTAVASQDGRTWQPVAGVRAVPKWGWAGRTLFTASDALLEVALDPVRARHLRVVMQAGTEESRLLCVRGTPPAR